MTNSTYTGSIYVCHRIQLYIGCHIILIPHYACASSDIDCGDPGIPTNVQRHGALSTVYTSEIRFSCTTGYTLQGSDRRTCQSNGEWSGSPPQCNRRFIIEIHSETIKLTSLC